MLEKDVVLSKISIIKNCLDAIAQVTGGATVALDDQFKQDVVVLNLQRAAQAAIDMAHTVIAERGLKLPTTYRESFHVLASSGLIPKESAEKMAKMVGFRNIAIHDYRALEVAILKSIVDRHLGDFAEYYSALLKNAFPKK